MITDEFRTYNPIINFFYFAFMIVCSCILMHPVCLLISLVGAVTYSVIQSGRKAIKINILYMIPAVIVIALLNPLFNHQGVTVLSYLPDGNPLTLESITYGICAAVMVISVIVWFGCSNRVMTSDKIIYLFGRMAPAISLVLSMTMRFVPKFIRDIKKVSDAQRGIGLDMGKGSIRSRIKAGTKVISVMVTRSLENSIETADSMKSRGYGTGKRTAFSIFRFGKRDLCILILLLALGTYIIFGATTDMIKWQYYPQMSFAAEGVYAVSIFLSYIVMAFLPAIIELWEVARWNVIKSKI